MSEKSLIQSALFLEIIQPNQKCFAESLSLEDLKQYLIMNSNPPKVEAHPCLYFKEAE